MFPITSTQLEELVRKLHKNEFQGRLMCFDPGETTGWALFSRYETLQLAECGQIQTWGLKEGLHNVDELLIKYRPNFLIYESYHIYDWKLAQHSFQEVPTLQIIGMIKTLCLQKRIKWHTQNAQTGKGFCTDDKLKQWKLYVPGIRHAMDAVRHGAHYLLFGVPQI